LLSMNMTLVLNSFPLKLFYKKKSNYFTYTLLFTDPASKLATTE